MGPEVYQEIHGQECEGGLCGASSHEEAEEDLLEERRCGQIPFQGNEVRCIEEDTSVDSAERGGRDVHARERLYHIRHCEVGVGFVEYNLFYN